MVHCGQGLASPLVFVLRVGDADNTGPDSGRAGGQPTLDSTIFKGLRRAFFFSLHPPARRTDFFFRAPGAVGTAVFPVKTTVARWGRCAWVGGGGLS